MTQPKIKSANKHKELMFSKKRNDKGLVYRRRDNEAVQDLMEKKYSFH
jgi:hypothetical protein